MNTIKIGKFNELSRDEMHALDGGSVILTVLVVKALCKAAFGAGVTTVKKAGPGVAMTYAASSAIEHTTGFNPLRTAWDNTLGRLFN